MPGACIDRLPPHGMVLARTRHPGKTGIGEGFLPHSRLEGSAAVHRGVRHGMDEAFSTANLLQWLSPCCYPTDTAEEIMRILSRREGFSATTIMRQQLLAA